MHIEIIITVYLHMEKRWQVMAKQYNTMSSYVLSMQQVILCSPGMRKHLSEVAAYP